MSFDAATPEQLAVFCQELVRAGDQPDAAVIAVTRAGLRDPQWPPAVVAERYLARDDVQAMVSVLKQVFKPRETKDISQQSITDDLEDVFQKAVQDRQYQPAIAAKKLQAEMAGMIRTKVDFTIANKVTELTTAELLKIASKSKVVDVDFVDVTPTP